MGEGKIIFWLSGSIELGGTWILTIAWVIERL